MFLNILKSDLKRKRTMNFILFAFIILATIFVASGLSNVLVVLNGTDYYMDKAGVGDYCIITVGDDATGYMEEILSKEELVKDYRLDKVVYASEDNILLESGDHVQTKNTAILQSIDDTQIHLFDSGNREVTSVLEGHVYVSGSFLDNNNLEIGDSICIDHNGTRLTFVLDGKLKDALLGSDFMGNTRFLMNEKDIEILLENEEIFLHYQGEIAYVDTDSVSDMGAVIAKIPNVNFSGSRSTIKMCYVMDLIVAFLVLILSVCLMIVSFLVLKFSINFTIMEEFREIGVMKAIGIRNHKIRSLYVVKYLTLATVGAIVGFVISVPFGKFLMKSVTENMILGNDIGLICNIVGAVLVVVAIVGFAYHHTRKVKKASPVDAIRSGQTGERYKKKTIYRIGKSHTKPSVYMAINDILSSPRRYITILLSFCICTLLVLIIVNATETMKSDSLIETFGTRADLYMTDVNQAMQDMNVESKKDLEAALEKREQELENLGMPTECSLEVWYKYPAMFEGREYVITCQQGVNCVVADYSYTEGMVPQSAEEIAITPIVSELTGAKIGDTITINFGTQQIDCMVTAYFESMNQLGEVIRLHEDAPTEMEYCMGIMQYKFTFTDNPSTELIESRKQQLKDYYDNEDVMNAAEYCEDCVAVADTMEAVQYLLLGITLVVVLLVTILMERAFIADEKSQIAMLKAMGFNNKTIITWHTSRFALVSLVAVILASVVSVPMTELCISPIFGMMGASDISYNIVLWKVFGLYPGIVVLATILISFIVAQYTRSIKSSDTAHIE